MAALIDHNEWARPCQIVNTTSHLRCDIAAPVTGRASKHKAAATATPVSRLGSWPPPMRWAAELTDAVDTPINNARHHGKVVKGCEVVMTG